MGDPPPTIAMQVTARQASRPRRSTGRAALHPRSTGGERSGVIAAARIEECDLDRLVRERRLWPDREPCTSISRQPPREILFDGGDLRDVSPATTRLPRRLGSSLPAKPDHLVRVSAPPHVAGERQSGA